MKKEWRKYIETIEFALEAFEFDEEILNIINNSSNNNQTIFIGGNGGSASIANHFLCDLSKPSGKKIEPSGPRYRIVSLCSNIDLITAISNDTNYNYIFSEQLKSLAFKNDILILISSSGNSLNVIKALETAKSIGMITIGITGFDGGYLYNNSNYKAILRNNTYEIIEDIHSIFAHFISSLLKRPDGRRDTNEKLV